MNINVHDIEAMCDTLRLLAEQSDELPPEQAVLIDKALNQLQSVTRSTQHLVRTQAVKALDGQPIKVGGSVFVAKATGKSRPNNERIKARVMEYASHNDDGERLKGAKAVPTAVARAVHAMAELYVADKTDPKVGGLKLLGVTKADVSEWERTGSTIEEIVTDGGHE